MYKWIRFYIFVELKIIYMKTIKTKIENKLKTLSDVGFHVIVSEYKVLNSNKLKVGISTSNKLINGVQGQYPDYISFSLSEDLTLKPQSFGCAGGQVLYRNTIKSDPSEKYIAMKGVKIPFRTPNKTEESVLKSIDNIINNYLKTLRSFKDNNLLRYNHLVNYELLTF